MNKITLAVLAACMSVPVFAQDVQPQAPKPENPALQQGIPGHEAFTKAHEEQMAKMKAKKDEMRKLVDEYNKLKAGKKKEAKRAEIEKEVTNIREEQLAFKKDQLGKFEQRLGVMKDEFAKENTPEGKKEWVNKKTDELINNNGSMRVLFDPGNGPRKHGPRHFRGKGPKGPRMGGRDGGNFPPPPDAELPVERPVEK